MGGKAKPTKHSAREISAKIKAATANVGAGLAGLEDRKGGKVGHSKFKCAVCGVAAPSLKSMQDHHENRHPSVVWNPEACTDLHELVGGVTTKGVAVRGTTDAKRLKLKEEKVAERVEKVKSGKLGGLAKDDVEELLSKVEHVGI